jgi:hypothetical protein
MAGDFPLTVVVRSMRLLQIPAQVHKQGNCNAHYNECTDTQDQEPPDHPHSRLG